MWDRTMIYVASDFGREKKRPDGARDWGTGHHVNNGIQVFSPLVPGDTLLGGVDADTGLTYGFDPLSGAPDPGRNNTEPEIFSGLLGALGVDTSGSGLPSRRCGPDMRTAWLLLAPPRLCTLPDVDHGFAADEDCDDANAFVYPGAPDPGDGIDGDCDGGIPATGSSAREPPSSAPCSVSRSSTPVRRAARRR